MYRGGGGGGGDIYGTPAPKKSLSQQSQQLNKMPHSNTLQSPIRTMYREHRLSIEGDADNTSISSSIGSATTLLSRSSTALNKQSIASSHVINERSDFFSPLELVPSNIYSLDPNAYQYWLRVGTMVRQLLLIQRCISAKRKQGRVFQVCFYGIDLVNVCELLQVVESREAAISLGESLLAHSIILEMYGTQEFKYKKKIYRFACDHNLLYFDGAAGGHLGDKQAFNVNPAVFEPCKRFRNEPNFVVAKIQEILRNGVESAANWEDERVSILVTLHRAERLKAKNKSTRMSSPYARLLLLNLWQSPPELFCFQVKHNTLHPAWDSIDKFSGDSVPTEACFTVFIDELESAVPDGDPEISVDLWDYSERKRRGLDRFLGRACIELSARRGTKFQLELVGRSAQSHVGGSVILSMRTQSLATMRHEMERRASDAKQLLEDNLNRALDSHLDLVERASNKLHTIGYGTGRTHAKGTSSSSRKESSPGTRSHQMTTQGKGLHVATARASQGGNERTKSVGSRAVSMRSQVFCETASPKEVRAITMLQRTFRSLYSGGRKGSRRASATRFKRPTVNMQCSLPSASSVRTDLTNPRVLFEDFIPESEEVMGYADGWPLDAVSVEAFGAGSLKQPFIADYASSHVLFYKLQQLSDSLDEADQQSLYTPQLLEKKEQNIQGLCLLLRVLDAENLFHNSQHAHSRFQPAHKSMDLNPYIKVYMVTSTSTQMQEQAVCSRVFRKDSNPHFDQYFWLWLADASDASDAWRKKLVHIEIWHRSDIGADLFLGGKILQLDGNSPATRGLSLRKGCCNVTTVELNTLAEQHAEMRRIKERFFGRSPTQNFLKTDDFFSSDEHDEIDDGMIGIGAARIHDDVMGSVQHPHRHGHSAVAKMRVKVQLVKHDKPPSHFHKVQYLQLPFSTFKIYVSALHEHLLGEDATRKATLNVESRALQAAQGLLPSDALVTTKQSALGLDADEALLWTNTSIKKLMDVNVVDMDITADLAKGSRLDALDNFVKKTLKNISTKTRAMRNAAMRIEYPWGIAVTPRRLLISTPQELVSVWFAQYAAVVVHDYPHDEDREDGSDTAEKIYIEFHKHSETGVEAHRSGLSVRIALLPDNYGYKSTSLVEKREVRRQHLQILHALLLEMACAWNTINHYQKDDRVLAAGDGALLSKYVQEIVSMNIRRYLVMSKLTSKVGPDSFLTMSFPDSKIGREELRPIPECNNIWQRNIVAVVADVRRFGLAAPNSLFVEAPWTQSLLRPGANQQGVKFDEKLPGNAGIVVHRQALAQLKKNFETEEFNFKNNSFKQAWQGSGKIGGIVQHLEMMYLIANQVYLGLVKGKRIMSDLLNWKHVVQASVTYLAIIALVAFHVHEYLPTLLLWALALNMLSYRFKKKIKRIQVKTRHKNIGDYINMAVYASTQVSTATHILAESNRLLLKLRCLVLGASKTNSMRFVWFLSCAVIATFCLPTSWLIVSVILLNFVAAYNFIGLWQRVGVWWEQIPVPEFVTEKEHKRQLKQLGIDQGEDVED